MMGRTISGGGGSVINVAGVCRHPLVNPMLDGWMKGCPDKMERQNARSVACWISDLSPVPDGTGVGQAMELAIGGAAEDALTAKNLWFPQCYVEKIVLNLSS
jgi:hypothetical protein